MPAWCHLLSFRLTGMLHRNQQVRVENISINELRLDYFCTNKCLCVCVSIFVPRHRLHRTQPVPCSWDVCPGTTLHTELLQLCYTNVKPIIGRKNDITQKTGSTQPIATLPMKDRATPQATCTEKLKLGHNWDMCTDRQSGRQTKMQTCNSSQYSVYLPEVE